MTCRVKQGPRLWQQGGQVQFGLRGVDLPRRLVSRTRLNMDTGKIPIWGLGGLGGLGEDIFTASFIKRIARKLRRIILLHFELIPVRFILGKPGNPSYSWFSNLVDVTMTPATNINYLRRRQDTPQVDVTMTPATNIIYLWRHQDAPHNSRTNESIKNTSCFRNIGTLDIQRLEKTCAGKWWRSV